MKRSDVPDETVIAMARNWQRQPLGPGVIEQLMTLGIPEKVALAKVMQLSRRGLLDYGVSPYYAWPTSGDAA